MVRVRSYEAGTLVGEIAFYTGAARSASVVAVQPTVAWRLTRNGLDRLAQAGPICWRACTVRWRACLPIA